MDSWKRRLKSSSVSSLTFCSRSSPLISRQLSAFKLCSGGERPPLLPQTPPPVRNRSNVGTCSCQSHSRRSAPSLERAGAGHELGLDADLLRGEAEAFLGRRLVHAL